MTIPTLYRIVDYRADDTTPMAYWNYWTAMLDAVRHCTYYRRITVRLMRTASTMIASSSTLDYYLDYLSLPVHCWHARHILYLVSHRGFPLRLQCIFCCVDRALATCTAWIISSLTVHLICTAYTIISMRYLIVLEYYYCVDYNCYMDYDYYASSSRLPLGEDLCCGHLLWMPTFFCPVPDWTVNERYPFSGLKVKNCKPCEIPPCHAATNGTPSFQKISDDARNTDIN